MKKYRISRCNYLIIYTFVIFFLFLIGEVGAATYYVSPNGSDSNSGSKSSPFKTIQKAAGIVNPGDTVIVSDGTYTDTDRDGNVVKINLSGTSSNWITFKSENKWGAKISGNNNASDYGVFFATQARYIRFEDFEIYGAASDGVWVDSNSKDRPTAWAHHIYLYRLKIHDIARKKDNSKYGNAGIAGDYPCHDVTVDSCIFYNIGRLNYYTTPQAVPGGSKSTNEATCTGEDFACYNHDHGMYFRGHDLTVINSIFYPDFKSGYCLTDGDDTYNWKIINNTFYGENPERDGHINLNGNNVYDILIQNNISYSPRGYFYQYNSSAESTILRNNLVYGASLINGTGCSDSAYTCSGNIIGQNPKFVNLSNFDFHIQSDSPAVNKGLAYSGRTYDADGHSMVGAPDIGAYEYGGSTPPPSEDTTPPAPPAIIEVK